MKRPRESKSKQQVLEDEDVMEVESELEEVRSESEDSNKYPQGSYFNLASSSEEEQIEVKRPKRSQSRPSSSKEQSKKAEIQSESEKSSSEEEGSSAEEDNDSSASRSLDEEKDSDDNNGKRSRKQTSKNVSSQNKSNQKGRSRAAHAISHAEFERDEKTRLQTLFKHKETLKPFISKKVYEKITSSKPNTSVGLIEEDDDDNFQTLSKQPNTIVSCTLRGYQLEGVNWMINNYENRLNCILADEMGLGKTLQTITFLSYLLHVKKISGPMLVIVPLTVLFNWQNEIHKWCPKMEVFRIHCTDPQEHILLRSRMNKTEDYDVIITTYEMVTLSGLANAFRSIVWRCVVLDEGHRIKNEKTDAAMACHKLHAQFKLLLTGTPLQNSLYELGSLLSFLVPTVFTDLTIFTDGFELSSKRNVSINRQLLDKAHYLLRIFQLRRLKSEVEQNLPHKLETKIECPMSDLQKEITQFLLFQERKLLEKISKRLAAQKAKDGLSSSAVPSVEDEKVSDNGENAIKEGSDAQEEEVTFTRSERASVIGLLAHLRKAANHPFLFPGIELPEFDGRAREDIITSSGKMMILDQLLKKLKEKNHRVVLFSQFTKSLDIVCDYLDYRGYPWGRLDGGTNRVMREVQINLFNRAESDLFVFCITTRAGGMGVNLCSADTVILFDSDWNPQVDIQAMARVHRIGQTKPVHVYRLVTKNTVEERIVERAQKKLFLDSMVNRGSTSNALAMDKMLLESKQKKALLKMENSLQEPIVGTRENRLKRGIEEVDEDELKESADVESEAVAVTGDGEDDEDGMLNPFISKVSKEGEIDEDDSGKIFSLLKFGWNSVFSVNEDANLSSADREKSLYLPNDVIERIIDRSRGNNDDLGAAPSKANSNSSSNHNNVQLKENQEFSVHGFDESAPLVSVDNLRQKAMLDLEKEILLEQQLNASGDKFKLPANELARSKTDSSALPSKRIRKSRLEEVHVTGVGAVSVLKENNPIYMENYDSSNFSAKKKADILEGFIRRRQKKLNKNNADEDKQQIYIPLKSGKQMAGRDYLHQDFCQVCWDGGELIVCEGCPCSYHLECLGLKKVPEKRFRWYCPHHQCVDCKKRHSVVGFLFRCEVCFQAYCEDCLPNESRLIGECKRFTEQGFRWPSNACYIRCCRDCIKFPMDKYLKMFKEQDEGMHAETIAGGRSVHDEDEAEEEEEEENDDQPSKKSKRKDQKKATTKKESSSKKSREKKNSSSAVSSKAAKNNNALTPSASISSTSNSSSLINKAKAFESLDYCVLPDIKYRLFRDDNPIYRSRFQSLFEIPNFLMRFEKANDVIKHLLIHIIQYIYYENMKTSWDENYLQEHKEQIKEEIDQIEHHKNKGSPGASASTSTSLISPSKKNSKQEMIERKDYHQDYYELFQLFSGVSMEHSNYFKLKMFLAVVNILSGVEKYYIPKMGEILGISEMQIRNENIRYSFPHIEKKSKLEEAIAALLVIPSPHNLIILAPKGTTTPPPAIIYPQDIYSYTEVEKVKDSYFLHFDNDYTQIANGIYLAVRYLQALHYPNYDIDSNRHFFTFYLETQGDLIGMFSNISLNTTPHHIYYKHIIKFWSYFLLLQPFFRTYNQVLEAKQKKGESEDDAVEIVWKKVLLENSTEDKDLKSKFKLSYAFPILYEIWKKFIYPPWQKIEEIMNMKRKTGSTVKLRKKDSLGLNEETNANEVELNDDFYDASGHLKNVKDIVFEALQKRREVLEKAFEEEIQRQIKQKEEEKKRKEAIFAANALAYQKMQEEKQQKEQLQKEQEQFQLQQKQQLLQQIQQQQQLQLQQQQLQQYRQYQEAQKQKQQQVNALQMHLKEQFQKLQQKSQPLVPNNFIPQSTAAVNPSSAYQTPSLQQLQQQYQYLLQQQQQQQTQQIAQRQMLAAQLMGLLPGMSQLNQPSSQAAMNPNLPTVASIMSDEPINLPPNSLPAVTASMLPPGEAAKSQAENHSSPPSLSPPSTSMMDLGEYYFPESNTSSLLPSSSSSGDNSYPKLVHNLQQQLTENQKRLEESMKILKFLETEEKRLQNERLLKETVKKSQTKSQKKASTSSTTSSSSSAKAASKNTSVVAPVNPPVTAATVPPPVTASLIPSTAKPSLKVASPPPLVATSRVDATTVSTQPQQVPPPAQSLSDPSKKEATAAKTSPGLYFDSSEKFSDGLKRNTPAPTVSAANIPASSSLATKLMKGYQINQSNPPVVSSSSPPATEKEDITTTSPGLYFDSSEKFSDGLKRNTPAPTVTAANIPASSSLATKLMKGHKIDQSSAKTASTTSSTSSGPISKASSDIPSVEKPQTSQKAKSKTSSSSTAASVMKQEAAKQMVELKATATEPVKEAKAKTNESSKKKKNDKSIFIDLSL